MTTTDPRPEFPELRRRFGTPAAPNLDHADEALKCIHAARMERPEGAELNMAQAQVHATLALVEQQRIANLIATEVLFTDTNGTTYPLRAWMPNARIDEIDIALGTWK